MKPISFLLTAGLFLGACGSTYQTIAQEDMKQRGTFSIQGCLGSVRYRQNPPKLADRGMKIVLDVAPNGSVTGIDFRNDEIKDSELLACIQNKIMNDWILPTYTAQAGEPNRKVQYAFVVKE